MPEQAPSPVPEGMSTVTPHLWFNGNCREAIDFYATALAATWQNEPIPAPDGSGVWHVMMQIGDSNIMAADALQVTAESGPGGTTTVGFWLYVADCDAWFDRAVAAGCAVIDPVADMFWGDRVGKVQDPYGHVWAFATHKLVYSEEEMAAALGG